VHLVGFTIEINTSVSTLTEVSLAILFQ